jgi:hypothetical protein
MVAYDQRSTVLPKITFSHPVRLTALIYLHEALLKERYEEMKEMLEIAREFGAGEWEIRESLMRNPEKKRGMYDNRN